MEAQQCVELTGTNRPCGLTTARWRDLLWARAKVEAKGGDLGEVFLPVLYPLSSGHQDEAIKLGRITDWIDVGGGLTRGVGQKLFLAGGQERGFLELAEIVFTEKGEPAPAQS